MPDLILNHVRSVRGKNSFDICKADEIVDFLVDFTSVTYWFEESTKLLSKLPEKYILVCPYSVSNPTWKTESRYHEYLRCLVSYIAKTHDIFDVVICGRCEDRIFGKPFWNNPSLRIFDLTNMTTICDMLTLINHAQNFVVYDSGMKNYAFLTQTPTCFIWNKKWHAANPVEAWFPKQLQTINNNILFDIWKWDENGNL